MCALPIGRRASIVAAALACGALAPGACGRSPPPRLVLTPCHVAPVQEELRCGTYEVFENRRTRRGKKLPLAIIVLPARGGTPQPDPVFPLSGGPGEATTAFVQDFAESPLRRDHDIVLVDARGTGAGHRLACRLPGSDDELEGYLRTPFSPDIARACLRELAPRAELAQYSTAAMIDDLDEVRQALGHDQIDLMGGSFGTYAALMYLRAHGDHVRAAYLLSTATLAARIPLYHAEAAQQALDRLFAQCDGDPACHAAYPALRDEFAAVLARLRDGPVQTWVRHPVTGAATELRLTERAFADAVRILMYSGERGREVPFLIHEASAGEFHLLAEAVLLASRAFYGGVPLGLYHAVTCSEFVARIRPEDIEPATRGSYLGAHRVKDQMASCQEWPKTELPDGYFAPFRSERPVVLISGDTDPVGLARWGDEAHGFLPNSLHLVVPGGHVPQTACSDDIAAQLFRTGSIQGLDLGCVKRLERAPFKRPPSALPAAPR